MSDLIWLSEAQMRRIEPRLPLPRGVSRVDDRRVISGIIFVIHNGLRWRDAPKDHGPHKAIYNRFIRWSRHREHVRQTQRFAARPHPLRSLRPYFHVLHLHLRNRHLLALISAF